MQVLAQLNKIIAVFDTFSLGAGLCVPVRDKAGQTALCLQ